MTDNRRWIETRETEGKKLRGEERTSVRHRSRRAWGRETESHNGSAICFYRSKQSIIVKTQSWNFKAERRLRFHKFQSPHYADWKTPSKDFLRRVSEWTDFCGMSYLNIVLIYVLLGFSELSFQQISSKWIIHNYLCWMKGECFST